jgi:ABC-type multidrug transport system fused ATPase/permease subunit
VAPSAEIELLLGDRAGDLDAVLMLLIGAGVLSFALALVNTRVAARLSSVATRDLRLHLHATLLSRPPEWLTDGPRANLVRAAMIDQVKVVSMYATNTLPSAIGITFAVFIWGHTLFLAVDEPGQRGVALALVAGIVLLLLSVNVVAVWIAGRKSQAIARDVMAQQAGFMGLAAQSVQHHKTLQLDLAGRAQHQRVRAVLERMSAGEIRVATWSGLATAASGGLVLLGIPLLVVLWQGLGLASASLAMMIPALLMLQRAVASVGSLWTTRKVARPALELVAEMMAPAPSIDTEAREPAGTLRGELSFRGVTWSAEGRPVLGGVDLEVAPGETVALVGRGGCGKSTLLRLALRLHDPDAGAVLLDGRDVRDFGLEDLRRRVGILEQHPAFFARSIRDNLVLDDRPVGDAELAEAARVAHFTEVIDQLGLERVLTDAGHPLSGSQQRRLALTRLLLRAPDVVLIDELEAGLPPADARVILATVREATAGKTCLMVTHRPDLLAADRVALVHEGVILAVGTHEDLEAASPEYRSLLADQRRADDALEH